MKVIHSLSQSGEILEWGLLITWRATFAKYFFIFIESYRIFCFPENLTKRVCDYLPVTIIRLKISSAFFTFLEKWRVGLLLLMFEQDICYFYRQQRSLCRCDCLRELTTSFHICRSPKPISNISNEPSILTANSVSAGFSLLKIWIIKTISRLVTLSLIKKMKLKIVTYPIKTFINI